MSLFSLLRRRIFEKRYGSHPLFKEFYRPVDLNQKIEVATFTVVDVETTGPDPRKAGLLSIGALKVKNLTLDLSTAFYRLVREENIERESIEIHGITREEVRSRGVLPEKAIGEFLEYVRGTVMVGFNVEFDRRVLDRTSRKFVGFPLAIPRLDVINLLKRKGIHILNLEGASRELDVPISGLHSAIDDAYTTALLFLKLIEPFRGSPLSVLPIVF